jgi:clan AA aspartic protease (TIGR02281 family)
VLEDETDMAWYVNSYIEPAFFGPNDVQNEINRLSEKFGQYPRFIRMPQRQGLPNAVLAVWGGIELKPLSSDEISTVAAVGEVDGICVSFLGDLKRSAKAGVPVYRLGGTAGFVWVATFNENGKGVLRFLTADASKFMPTTTSGNPEVTPKHIPTAALNAADQSRIYGELGRLHQHVTAITNDQNLTTLQRTTELQAASQKEDQLTIRANTQVNDWQCIVNDVTNADTHFDSVAEGMKWVVNCKFEDLTFSLWSRSDTQLMDIRKGSVVHFEAQTICDGGNCEEFPTDFALQNIRLEKLARTEAKQNVPEAVGSNIGNNQKQETKQPLSQDNGSIRTDNQEQENPAPNAISASLESQGGTYVVPVLINNAITLNFIVDSGATDVSIPADVVMTLVRTGTLKEDDFIGKQTYALADGSTVPSDTFRIKSLKVGDKAIENVTAAIAPVQGTLLLGQSFLNRFSSWSIDNTKHVLILK